MLPGKVPVYCHMSRHGLGACGAGGWTLATLQAWCQIDPIDFQRHLALWERSQAKK